MNDELGYDNFEHLLEIKQVISKALILSDRNEFVIDTADQLANDTVLLACKNEPYGEDLQHTITAFSNALEIGQPNNSALKKLSKYCNDTSQSIIERQNSLLQRDKNQYEPSFRSLVTLENLMQYTDNKEHLEFLYIHSCYLYTKKQSKKTEEMIQVAYDKLKQNRNTIITKKLRFTLFGKPVIK